jgi:hypothetical protein
MPNAYSADLRERVVGAVNAGTSRGSVAPFGIGLRVICERAQFTSQAAT